MEVSVGFITIPSRRHLSHTHLSRATCEQPKISGEGNIPGSCPAVNQTHNQQQHALEFQPEFLESAQEFKKTPSREAPQILPFQIGCRLPRQHFLQLAGAQTRKQITTPKAISPWKLWNRSSEFIRVLKAPVLAAVHNRMKSKHFCFFSPLSSLSPHPTAFFQQCLLLE